MEKTIKVGLIYGSTREGRFCDKVAAWAADQIVSSGKFSIDIIDPLAISLDAGKARKEHSPSLRELVDRAEAFVVVTPEYNHGYPAPLKALIDSVGTEWQAKPVAFVSYGGVSGGLRAVEQLRQVFAELHAVTMRDAVSFAGAWEQFDQSGKLREPGRANKSMTTMLARLHWWAVALRAARSEAPYSTAA
jgi:NAD(P)H-dependent FMN reductase